MSALVVGIGVLVGIAAAVAVWTWSAERRRAGRPHDVYPMW